MKITVNEIIASSNSLVSIGSLKLSTAIKFRLGRVISQVREILNEVDRRRVELMEQEGGIRNKTTNLMEFPTPEIEKKVQQEIIDLGKEEVEIRFDKFSEDTFENLEISSNDIANCLWLFDETKPKAKPKVEKHKDGGK